MFKLTWNFILVFPLTIENEFEHPSTVCGFNENNALHDFQFNIRANGKPVEMLNSILCKLHLQCYQMADRYEYIELK